MSAEEEVQSAIRVADRVLQQLSGAQASPTDIVLRCPDTLGTASFKLSRPATGAIEISHPALKHAELVDLTSFRPVDGAVIRSREDALRITFPNYSADYGLRIEFDLADRYLLRRLVHRNADREPVEENGIDAYWISAQLKSVTALRTRYGRVNLRDVDFLLNVGIQSDLKTAVPPSFVRQMEVGNLLVKERDRNKKLKLMFEQLHLQRAGPADSRKVLKDMQDMFMPSEFARFVSVKDEFRFQEIRRGTDGKDGGLFGALPQSMMVISHTNLGVDQPAAQGRVLYQKRNLIDKLATRFPKAMTEFREGEE
jgi:hypothetical protein